MIKRGRLAPILFSSFLFSLSFLYPFYLVVFFIFIPVFYYAFHQKLSFFHGICWGFLLLCIHSFPLIKIVMREGKGTLRIFAPLLAFLYISLFTAIWFSMLSKKNLFFKSRVIEVVCISLIYFFVIDFFVLTPFGVVEGYPLVFPLIPLARCRMLLSAIALWGPCLLLMFLLLFQASCAWSLKTRRLHWGLLAIIPFFLGRSDTNHIPDWSAVQFVKAPARGLCPLEHAQELCINLLKAQKKGVSVFVMEEGAFPFPLNKNTEAIAMWTENCLQDDKILILGANKKEGEKLYNCLFVIYQGRIILTYEKSHLISFFERRGFSLSNSEYFNTIFLHNKEEFNIANSSPTPLFLSPLGHFLPVICSEIFWQRRNKYPSTPRLCLMKTDRFEGYRWDYLYAIFGRYRASLEEAPFYYVTSNSAYWAF